MHELRHDSAAHSPLQNLVRPDDYRVDDNRSRFYLSAQSLSWYIRGNRDELQAVGALHYIAGKMWINPGAFDSYVIHASAARPKGRALNK